ncbi:DUF6340 family protein [Aureibaculum sp. 2210JD6-5]|uniref:DUF6340 family protein n=1 Tax=Aureibaculum sp. 2210JD6-5 TaxID=3103957 RepID=UPI002AAE2F8E|nr:DUF6340 family protein [Aureibaculum sp. 2210JD6-5]MDY7395637.1 DUF6340 family protein [Aureibaculum sp. 2210JD6-5]
MKLLSKSTILIILLALVLSSCATTNKMTMGVLEPAPVYMPKHNQKIGIIDRSLPSDNNAELDKLDKVLSAEGKNLDKEGAHRAILGLSDKLGKNQSFDEVKIIEDANLRSPGSGVFPATLSWETVKKICDENGVDALYVLEFFDTDSEIDYKTVQKKIKNPLGVEISVPEHHATIYTKLKTGWRVYDPQNKLILDEYRANQNITSTGKGINPAKAIAAIAGRKEAVLERSNNIGYNYGARILPRRVRVSRDYFIKGTDKFEIANRRAIAGKWDSAAELWNEEVSNSDSKIAGRACYNMAIINEINGELDTAIEWAQKAYADYEIKEAIRYIKILKHRKENNRLLASQN